MLNQLHSLTELIGGHNALIDQWLQARKQLLLAYYHLVGIKPNKGRFSCLDEKALDDFHQNLVDYLSSGHFHAYDRILQEAASLSEQKRFQTEKLDLALQNNTQQMMDFYDSHLATSVDRENCMAFQQALSSIGEALEARFTLEDKMIRLVCDNQRPGQ